MINKFIFSNKVFKNGDIIESKFKIIKIFEEITLSKDYISIRKLDNGRTLMGISYYGKVYGDNDTNKPYYYLQLGLTKKEAKEQGYNNQKYAYLIKTMKGVV